MKEFKGKVAVITGAASGIGRGLADRCAQEGMKVVLADVEEKALTQTEAEMSTTRATVLAVLADVSKPRDVEALAQKTLDSFGAVHLLCNNAGVAGGSSVWETTVGDWEWVMGVNLWGVIHGARAFVPIMLEQGTECHIVNTASIAGLLPYHPLSASYQVTKHAVVALSEQLHYELAQREAKVKVSVLCPGWVRTRIMESGRNRPTALQSGSVPRKPSSEYEAIVQQFHEAIQAGVPPEQVADYVFKAIREERLYILPAPEWKPAIQTRMEDILQERNPVKSSP